MNRIRLWPLVLVAIIGLGLILRLKGIHDPLLDHPGWRQGDTAAIARNFATLDLNPLHPQTDYDGAPPNYVELELQIVPFLAALLYKLFGVHEIFGRLISLIFSLGTIGLVGYFARFLFQSSIAGLAAALAFAIMPGSIYYGRSFMPDTTMVFFLTAALYSCVRWMRAEPQTELRALSAAAALSATAILAKPVAIIALVPVAAMMIARFGIKDTLRRPQAWIFLIASIAPYELYDAYLRSIAEWHWTSGITSRHVLPSLAATFTSTQALVAKWQAFLASLGMLRVTMLGEGAFWLSILSIFIPMPANARLLLFGWLGAGIAYVFVVMTVEPVDYYAYLFLPLAALWIGGAVAILSPRLPAVTWLRSTVSLAALIAALAILQSNRAAVASYYFWNPGTWSAARALDKTLAPKTLIVMGHLDPSVLYYINRKGWEEDPRLWRSVDEESAIHKGARYYVAIEPNRLARNPDLSEYLARFPVDNTGRWPVYNTDPAKLIPTADARWHMDHPRLHKSLK
ncbi:MAG TPA: glycosyltransferase family 39 protein [Candidatus Baltobacteraceae bacterium]|jgi:hypothetical protein|nr:glycosyltransferase family 39 protein [Candidatus Baltobacteraceae bacterium]